jgi:hypothetical protein
MVAPPDAAPMPTPADPRRRRSRPRAVAALALGAALCLGATPALAQQPADPVEDHLRRGFALRREGRAEESVASFAAAYALRPEARTAAQLGLAYQSLGRWLPAEPLLRQALAAPADPWVARNRAALLGAVEVVERHLAWVGLVGDAGARVRVNGADAGALPLAGPVRVVAGSVTVEVAAEGFEPLTLRFVAAPGETLQERAALVPLPAPAPAPPAPAVVVAPTVAPAPAPPWRPLAVGAFVGGGALVVGGAVALVLRELAASDYNDACDAGDAAGACGDRRDRASVTLGVGLGTLPVGVALAAAGTVFALRARGAAARVAVGVGPAGALCRVAF